MSECARAEHHGSRAPPHPEWGPAPPDLQVSQMEVHVWRARLDIPAHHLRNLDWLLSRDERVRAERFVFVEDRRAFITTRALLRALLARYVGEEAHQLRFRYGPRGKPELAPGNAGLRFNVSHSHGLALFAVTRGRKLGVDVERIREDIAVEEIVKRFFSPEETVALTHLPKALRRSAFLAGWTRKEAFLKATGDGIARGLHSFDSSLAPHESAMLLRIDGDPHAARDWRVQDLYPERAYRAALVVEGHDWRLRCFEWPLAH